MSRRSLAIASFVGLLGCGDALSADSYMGEDQPPYGCDSEPTGAVCGSSTSDGTAQQSCAGSIDCGGDAVCVADFDGDIGQFSCQSCIEAVDETRWCFDDSACCDPLAVCTRGYCLPSADATSTTALDSTGPGETADSSGGTSSSGSTDASSSGGTTDGGTSTTGGSSSG